MKIRLALSAACFALLATTAHAQGGPPPAGQGPGVCLSQKTGIPEGKIKSCFETTMKNGKPGERGAASSQDPEAGRSGLDAASRKAFAGCLKAEKPKLSRKQLKQALEDCRPDGPPPSRAKDDHSGP